MASPDPPPRFARVVLTSADGGLLGCLPPVPCSTPWWQEAFPVVEAVRAHLGVDITVLRLLKGERSEPRGGMVTYLAEASGPANAEPWGGTLDDHPLRLPYARPGGPRAELDWADATLKRQSLRTSGPARQMRSWNLSSIWRIPTLSGTAWLKTVPPFFAHEGAVIAALAGEPVPTLLGHHGPRILVAEIPGNDLYEATRPQLLAMVTQLVGIQTRWLARTEELLAIGLPDWRGPALTTAIVDVVARTRHELPPQDCDTLDRFVEALPQRFDAVTACGIGDTLVHGDFHAGNHRGIGDTVTLLDWGDSGVGHPLLDQPAFFEKVGERDRDAVRARWSAAWRDAIPSAKPERAAALLAPVAAARQAVIYRKFLDNIEPSERVYHRSDPALWLQRTATLLR